jgi:hypothetical protein
MEKVLAFDLHDTLAVTKSPLSDGMSGILGLVLHQFDVFVISGGKFELFEKQVIGWPEVDAAHLRRLYLMPTCSRRYYRYDEVDNK